MIDIDPECEARAILERAGYHLDDVPGAGALTARLLGQGAVRRVAPRHLRGAEGEICTVAGQTRIYLSNVLTRERAAFVALHELAHWHLGLHVHGGAELEAACDAIAGALTCPRGAFRSAVREHGHAWEQLALDFATDASCVALRLGEVVGVPLALVSPRSVRVRGSEDAALAGDEQRLRSLAKASRMPAGLVREVVPDDRRRVLILVDAA